MKTLLSVESVHAHYGKSHVLQGVSLHVGDGELVTLLGRNGAGKTTTLKTIAGVMAPTQGQVRFSGEPVHQLATHLVAQRGICLVPEHRGIFKLLTVEENLLLGQRKHSPWQLPDVYRIFPRLKERRANGGGQLSGGEQQMLAIGRALMTNPKLLILDEATEGLAPLIRAEIWRVLGELRAAGMAMIVVDKNLGPLMALADQHVVIEKGRVAWHGNTDALRADQATVEQYLGV